MKIKKLNKNYLTAAVLLIMITAVTCCSTAYKSLHAVLPDLTEKQDGAYRGEFDLSGTPVKVTLDVIIRNQKISSINIVRHMCSPIGKKAESIIEKIIAQQNLEIDAVSGATGSSKTILKAVENALE